MNLPIFVPSKAAPKPTLRSIIVEPATPSDPKDPLITVVPSILKHVLDFFSISPPSNFLINLNIIHINEDTIIPSYFCDNELLIHLAFITFPQLGDDALKKLALDYMDEDVNEEENIETENAEQERIAKDDDDIMADENEVQKETMQAIDSDVDVEILKSTPAIFMTPRRNKPLIVKEKLDNSFLRHNKRISNKLKGFKDTKSDKKAQVLEKADAEVMDVDPLAFIPPPSSTVAPHLSEEILKGIAISFFVDEA